MKKAFQWHKQLLRVLQWKLPNGRWILKAPIHLFGLDHLIETYPDAKMVSVVSMACHWTQVTTGQANLQIIAD